MCMRRSDREKAYRLSINQAVTVNLLHMHEGSYRHLLNMHEGCTEKKWHRQHMHQVVIDGNWHRPHMNEGAILKWHRQSMTGVATLGAISTACLWVKSVA